LVRRSEVCGDIKETTHKLHTPQWRNNPDLAATPVTPPRQCLRPNNDRCRLCRQQRRGAMGHAVPAHLDWIDSLFYLTCRPAVWVTRADDRPAVVDSWWSSFCWQEDFHWKFHSISEKCYGVVVRMTCCALCYSSSGSPINNCEKFQKGALKI